MKKLIIALAVCALFSVTANAAPKAAPASSGGAIDSAGNVEPDKGDGCGLGWQVTQKRTMLATTTRGTTNSFVPPTFGMTTGTIGCEQHSFAKKDQKGIEYVASNHENLAIEMAEGHGEYLQAYARTLGCGETSMNTFTTMTQKNYENIVSENSVELYHNSKAVAIAAGCNI